MKKYKKINNTVFDLAGATVTASVVGPTVLLVFIVAVLIAVAVVLIRRARRKNDKDK
ncbi:MAG: hypothetical protein FWE14_13105 [Lachnospiraceae bacterium]|nr:hypothetical protein [Lachnospiraceae bacterium]